MEKLAIGSSMPSFAMNDQNGNLVSNESLKGKKTVIYFYPKDNTPGCTAQACSIGENYEELLKLGIQVIGVSADDVKPHLKFTEKYNLPFPLLPDTDKTLIQLFGVWGEKKFMGKTYDGIHRTTFLFDENNILLERIDKPDTKNHASEIKKTYNL